MPSRRNYQQAQINISASGLQTICQNPSKSAFMYIWEVYLTCAGATNLTFYNGAGPLTGNINVLAGGTFSRQDLGSSPAFTIEPNASFSISEAVGVQKSGYVHFSN